MMMFTTVNASEFDEIYAIMEASFPPDERRTFAEQRRLMDQTQYKIYAERAQSGAIVAFLAVWEFETFVFLEHLAVTEQCRNQGLGARLLQEVCKRYGLPACLEVEPPTDQLTRRRVGFYQRNGFVLNEYDYVQPSISAGRQPVPLMLMTSPTALTVMEFETIRQKLYRTVYNLKV